MRSLAERLGGSTRSCYEYFAGDGCCGFLSMANMRCDWLPGQKAVNHFFQSFDPERMFVHAGNSRELLSTRRHELFASAHSDFFNRFQAIRHKRRTNDEHLLFT